jgi:hypothetical protein
VNRLLREPERRCRTDDFLTGAALRKYLDDRAVTFSGLWPDIGGAR